MTDSVMRIGALYPDLLGTYGDRGNAAVLAERLRVRGIPVEVVTVLADDAVPASLDCYVIGGGEDHAQTAAAQRLIGSPLVAAYEAGASIVGVCAGFQLLGRTLPGADGIVLDGLGIIDATTVVGATRQVGDVVLEATDPSLGELSGFENHRGVTEVHDDLPPLGHVLHGGVREGVLTDRMLATYLHGPVLVRNPALADRVLSWTTGPLAPIADDIAVELNHALVTRFGNRRSTWLRARRRARA